MTLVTEDIPLSQVPGVGAMRRQQRLLTAYTDLADREEAALREARLPLERINWDLYASVAEAVSGEWMPARFNDRQRRLGLYRNVFDGDIVGVGGFLADAAEGLIEDRSYARVLVNSFRQACLFKADLLTSTEIVQTPEVVPAQQLQNVASRAVVLQERDGGAIVNAGVNEAGPFLRVIDPSCWFPRADGGTVVAVPYTSDEAPTSLPDRLRMHVVEPDGRTMEFLFDYTSLYSRGSLISRRALPDRNWFVKIVRAPEVPGWGTSLFDDLAPVLVEYAVRMTSYSKILNAHESPMLNLFVSDEDMPDFGGSTPVEAERWREGADDDARGRAAQAAAELRRMDVSVGLDSSAKLQYLTWDGQLAASNAYLERLEQQVSKVSGIPLTLMQGQEVASGVALRRLFLPLYASTLAVLNDTRYALETALSAIVGGSAVKLEWPHPFDFQDLEEEDRERRMMTALTDDDTDSAEEGAEAEDDDR